jgi:CRP-like cAMP-binding protein
LKLSATETTVAAHAMRAGGWLSRTPAEFQDAVLARCLWSRVPGGTALTHGGDREGGMYGIASGMVEVTPAVGPADLPIINIARAPYWFGLLPVGLGAPRAVGITTRGPCDVAVVPQAVLTALLTGRPDWWQLLTAQALEHFNTAAQCAADLLIPDSRRRCIAVLLRAAGQRGGDSPATDAGVSQNELAAMANMSRQTTGNLLRGLAAEGFLELGYRSIVLRDVAGLKALLDA